MAVIEMKKVILVGMQDEKEDILKAIQSMGNLEIMGIEEQGEGQDGEETLDMVWEEDLRAMAEAEAQLSKLEFTLELFNRYKPLKRGIFDVKPQVEARELLETLDSRDEILKIADQCRSLEEELSELALRENRLYSTIGQMEPWMSLDIPLDRIEDTLTTRVIAGTVDRGAVHRFLDAIDALAEEPIFVQELGETREDTCFFIVYHKSLEGDVQSILNEFAFNRTSFGGFSGTAQRIVAGSREELREISRSRDDIVGEIIEFTDLRPQLELLYDALLIELDRYRAIQNLEKTHSTFVLKGWVPAEQSDEFVTTLGKEFKDIYIKLQDPDPDEDFPVALDNPPLVSPFEMVTNLYSTPNPRELDPNAAMAPFFAVFFGIMMGDAGYGLIMALGTYWFLRKMKPKDNTKKLVSVIFIGSIFTFIWGAIFGGWFGNAGELLGIPPLWFNPSAEPIKMLVFCFAMGVLHIFAGIGVNAYVNIRKGRILDAIFDQGLWYVFYIGLILWLAGGMAGLDPTFSQVGKIMTIVGAVGLVLTQGRDKDNIFAKFFSGLLSLYDVTGFLSDVLSYSRLFALALTTGVIGTVINQLGIMAGKSWYGWILAAAVLIGGHVFNIAINVLGAFVHTSRLQYIEFYGKFYQGGGRLFKPLGMRTKYRDIKK
ncbi:MAG TPA: V-type ATP synthase subunit I [Clostridiales bacterium]|jgi:V/A-type H+-transporting ATPase subunit I|nr:V-type ATP synthase subunit I [Clostridiales bacterium]